MTEREEMDIKTYQIVETRLYGELLKSCRRYSNDLHLISILGILELVKQEMSDLDKTGRTFSRSKTPNVDETTIQDDSTLDTIH
ncbi:MAG: hypothetical protein V1726_00685 [Methanobacteriota archaeon]